MKVAISGASGYIGGRLAVDLVRREVDVVAVGRRRVDWLPDAVVQVDTGPTWDIDRLTTAFADADVVIHLAGAHEVHAAEDPDGAVASTIAAARHAGLAASAAGVRRVVYVSTVHVYGASMTPGTVIDEMVPPSPRHPYAIARLAAEHVLAAEVDDLVVLRLTNATGAAVAPPVDRWSLVTNDLCREVVTSGTVTLRSSGLQWRDFVTMIDVLAAVRVASEPGRVPPGTYNFGAGRCTTIREVAVLVQDAAVAIGLPRPPLQAPDPEGPPLAPYRVVVDKAATRGMVAATPLAQSVEETMRFCVEHQEAL